MCNVQIFMYPLILPFYYICHQIFTVVLSSSSPSSLKNLSLFRFHFIWIHGLLWFCWYGSDANDIDGVDGAGMCVCVCVSRVNLWNDTRRINFVNKISIVVLHAEHGWWKWNGNRNETFLEYEQASNSASCRTNVYIGIMRNADFRFSLLFFILTYIWLLCDTLFIQDIDAKRKTKSGNNSFYILKRFNVPISVCKLGLVCIWKWRRRVGKRMCHWTTTSVDFTSTWAHITSDTHSQKNNRINAQHCFNHHCLIRVQFFFVRTCLCAISLHMHT